MYKTLFSFCLYVCTFACVCVCMCVCTIAIVCLLFNVKFLRVRLSLVDETVCYHFVHKSPVVPHRKHLL